MPEIVSCPKCQRKSRVPDTLVGKKVKCPGCSEIFTAAVNGAAPPPPKPKKKDDDGYEVVEDKKKKSSRDDEDEAVSDKPRPRRARDEEEEEDKPRRSKSPDRDDDDDERVTSRRRNPYARDRDDDDDEDDDDDDDDDRPRRRGRKRRTFGADWVSVRRGLTLVLIALVVMLVWGIVSAGLNFVLGGASAFAVAGGGPGGLKAEAASQVGHKVVAVLGMLVTFAALGLRVAGLYFCLPSPQVNAGKGLAMASLILGAGEGLCQALLMIVSIATQGLASLGGGGNPMLVAGKGAAGLLIAFAILWVVVVIADFFVFLVYLRSIALTTGYASLARNVIIYIITVLAAPVALCVISCAGAMVMGMTMAAAAGPQKQGGQADPAAAFAAGGAMGLVCVGIWLIFFLAMIIWRIVLVFQTRNAAGTQVRGA